MTEERAYGRAMTTRIAAFTVLLAGLFWIDPLFLPLVLVGPIVTGVVAARHDAVRPAAMAWFAAGLITLVLDWAINDEDQAFHLVMAVWTAGVTLASGMATARTLRRRALRNGISGVHRQAAGS